MRRVFEWIDFCVKFGSVDASERCWETKSIYSLYCYTLHELDIYISPAPLSYS